MKKVYFNYKKTGATAKCEACGRVVPLERTVKLKNAIICRDCTTEEYRVAKGAE